MSDDAEGAPALPLSGRRVVDFSQGVAGPSCAMLLGDLGADVIKVEPPEGDWVRAVGSSVAPHESAAHLAMNRGKRSLCMDLRHPRGRELARRLAERADVVVHNFRRGVMERLGLGWATLSAANPKLVHATVLGFGDDGPLADAPATDSVMQAYGGLMSINGDDGGPPLRMGNMVSDMLAGAYLSQGVLAALLMLPATGRGRRVSVSLLDALLAFQAAPLMEHAVSGRVPARSGRNHPMIAPSGTYRARDGFVTLVATQQLWGRFCQAVGMPELEHDPRFADNASRLAHRDALQARVVPFVEARTKAQMLALAREHDLVCAPINDYDSLRDDAQVRACATLRTWTHPVLGTFEDVRDPVRIEGVAQRWGPPPMLGEHGEAILAEELGMTPAQIGALFDEGIVAGPRER